MTPCPFREEGDLTIDFSFQPFAVDVTLEVDHVPLVQAELVVELSHEGVPERVWC